MTNEENPNDEPKEPSGSEYYGLFNEAGMPNIAQRTLDHLINIFTSKEPRDRMQAAELLRTAKDELARTGVIRSVKGLEKARGVREFNDPRTQRARYEGALTAYLVISQGSKDNTASISHSGDPDDPKNAGSAFEAMGSVQEVSDFIDARLPGDAGKIVPTLRLFQDAYTQDKRDLCRVIGELKHLRELNRLRYNAEKSVAASETPDNRLSPPPGRIRATQETLEELMAVIMSRTMNLLGKRKYEAALKQPIHGLYSVIEHALAAWNNDAYDKLPRAEKLVHDMQGALNQAHDVEIKLNQRIGELEQRLAGYTEKKEPTQKALGEPETPAEHLARVMTGWKRAESSLAYTINETHERMSTGC